MPGRSGLFIGLALFVAILHATWNAFLRSGGGLVATVAYAVVVAAFALGPAGPITALRETSIVFAVLIGWLFLGETMTVRRTLACLIGVAGRFCSVVE